MLSIDQALAHVLQHATLLEPRSVPLTQALGLVLAREVHCDIDSPPHDKAMVDGYACCLSDLADGSANLTVLEQITAGQVPTRTLTPGTASQIMTGAPIPPGADGVIMVEQSERTGPGTVRLRAADPRPRQNILDQGTVMKAGTVVLPAQRELRPIEIGLLAEVGCHAPLVYPRPRVAILATGNELVRADQRPQAGQIRNSNGPLLEALTTKANAAAVDLGIAPDEQERLQQLVAQGLECDLLVLSGGVSAGVLDLVPQVLDDLGVEEVFHKINLKPGKPLWFGTRTEGNRKVLVFGLPGNPVSGLVCFELFVRPAILARSGRQAIGLTEQTAMLAAPFQQRANRPTYFPAKCHRDEIGTRVTPLPWKGSADQQTLTDSDCFVLFEAGKKDYAVGDTVPIFRTG